jgi:hypothetical protein
LRFGSIPVQCSVLSLSLFLSFFIVFYNYPFLDLFYSPFKSLSAISCCFIISCHSLSAVLVSCLIYLFRILSHFSVCFWCDNPQWASGRVISSSQRPLPDNTQQTDIHAPGGIRTHNLSRRAAADLHLRPRGHWDRLTLFCLLVLLNFVHSFTSVYISCFDFVIIPSLYSF